MILIITLLSTILFVPEIEGKISWNVGGPKRTPKVDTSNLNLTDWKTYVETFSGFYKDLTEDNEFRRNIFDKNVRSILKWNYDYDKGLHNFTQGINPFTAKTKEEMMKMSNKKGNKIPRPVNRYGEGHWNFPDNDSIVSYRKRKRLPDNFDWRDEGIIPEVKYQGECAACYAFTALDTVEARYNLYHGNSEPLSSQMIVDCTLDTNEGCTGGYLHTTFEFLKKLGGAVLEEEYPYEGKEGKCRLEGKTLAYKFESLVYVEYGNEKVMKKLLVTSGPIAVSLDSEPDAFQKYHGGIFDDPNCKEKNLEHTGVLVGYGREGDKDYWIVKNSWSEWWGEGGYIRVRRNYGNRCGVASNAIYPII